MMDNENNEYSEYDEETVVAEFCSNPLIFKVNKLNDNDWDQVDKIANRIILRGGGYGWGKKRMALATEVARLQHLAKNDDNSLQYFPMEKTTVKILEGEINRLANSYFKPDGTPYKEFTKNGKSFRA